MPASPFTERRERHSKRGRWSELDSTITWSRRHSATLPAIRSSAPMRGPMCSKSGASSWTAGRNSVQHRRILRAIYPERPALADEIQSYDWDHFGGVQWWFGTHLTSDEVIAVNKAF